MYSTLFKFYFNLLTVTTSIESDHNSDSESQCVCEAQY